MWEALGNYRDFVAQIEAAINAPNNRNYPPSAASIIPDIFSQPEPTQVVHNLL